MKRIKMPQTSKQYWLYLLSTFTLGVVAGVLIFLPFSKKSSSGVFEARPLRVAGNKYTFINPLLAYEIPEAKDFEEFTNLENSVQDLITEKTRIGKVADASVYFRDLGAGRWVGINENATYEPASLMKVAIMLAFFVQARENPGVLSQKFVYKESLEDAEQNTFRAPSHLQSGTEYSVDELIKSMIVDSDNGAKDILLDHMNPNTFLEVFTDLGMQYTPTSDYTISVKNYSLFFRILYNATYITPELSEKALRLLSEAVYKDGLVGGVPEGVKVAHKFGERVITNPDQTLTLELHDCGIIYAPDSPYLLCVMTKGKDLSALSETIQAISKTVFSVAKGK